MSIGCGGFRVSGDRMNYEEADEFLHHARHGKPLQRKNCLETCTYLRRYSAQEIHLVLHSTPIICWAKRGSLVLNSGGFDGPTTQQRLREYLPVGFRLVPHQTSRYSPRFWLLNTPSGYRPWKDHMVLEADGTLVTQPHIATEDAYTLFQEVEEYARLFVDAILADRVPRTVDDCTPRTGA